MTGTDGISGMMAVLRGGMMTAVFAATVTVTSLVFLGFFTAKFVVWTWVA